MSSETIVTVLPNCDFCKENGSTLPAHFDGRTCHGYWAHMCNIHYGFYGTGLGTGKGQRLTLRTEDEPATPKLALVQAAVRSGDVDAVWDAIGDGDPAEYL